MPVFATPSPTTMMTAERQDSNNTDDEEIVSFTHMDNNTSVPMITNIKTKFEPKFEVGHKVSTTLNTVDIYGLLVSLQFCKDRCANLVEIDNKAFVTKVKYKVVLSFLSIFNCKFYFAR